MISIIQSPAKLQLIYPEICNMLTVLFIVSCREESDVRIIENLISDFLQYLEVNRSKYFTSKNYVEATEEYLAKTPSGVVDPIFS